MRGITIALLIVLYSGLAACAHPRPKTASGVAIPATQIRATEFGGGPQVDPLPSSFMARAMAGHTTADRPALCVRPDLAVPSDAPPVRRGEYLVLSGGSLNGAFGAGFFLGLQEKHLLPPEPEVVTGVSTGSLQATFLFLAQQSVPNDRHYRWVGGIATRVAGADERPALAQHRSNIEDLALAYSITRESDILKPAPLGGLGLLFTGAMGSLNPLRQRLFDLISPNTIRSIAIEACRGRKLFVGVTNVDDGYGYALDLTALALRAYDGAASDNLMTQVRQTYVDGLIASSSVPAGAKPVSLRIRDLDLPDPAQHRINLFVDGGARFGVFLKEIRSAQQQVTAAGGISNVSMIVNTGLVMGPWHDGDDLRHPTTGWLLTTLGPRTIDILENQVYQLSVGAVQQQSDNLRLSYISNYRIDGGEEPGKHVYDHNTCDDWHALDETDAHPIQFYPRYMACLIDYGRQRGQGNQWNKATP